MKKKLKTIIASALVAAMMLGTSLTACAAPATGAVLTQVTPNGVLVYNYYIENYPGQLPTAYPAEFLLAIDMAGITNEMSEYEKCVRINNYLCAVTEYGRANENIGESGQSGMDIFRYGKVVCGGYTHAFQTMATMLNIECTMQFSTQLDHAWNKVTIDGIPYYVDVTYNDDTANAYLMSPVLWADHTAADIMESKNTTCLSQPKPNATTENGVLYNVSWDADITQYFDFYFF